MVKILLLGSTGSIGTSVLNCVRRFPDKFSIVGLAAGANIALLAQQVQEFSPQYLAVGKVDSVASARAQIPHTGAWFTGEDGLAEIVRSADYDVMLNALVGAVGFLPTVEALKRGKRVALANKESLVIGGEYLNALITHGSGELLPVDSEHSAILQCMGGESVHDIESIILTASGGPFREFPLDKFKDIKPKDALKHPTWQMGKKITIDSATLMNKGFEVIEAHHLFHLSYEHLRVWIHPQSIIHSLVEFHDGAIIAQMGLPDMELPIQYALSYPERFPMPGKRLNLPEISDLSFHEADFERFPCLRLCLKAGKAGGTMPTVVNAANEIAVGLFLEEKIGFNDIPRILDEALSAHTWQQANSVETIVGVDQETRRKVSEKYF